MAVNTVHRPQLGRACPADSGPRGGLSRAGHPGRIALKSLFATYLDLPCGVVVQDPHGIIIDANPLALALLGLGRERLLGLSFSDPCWRASGLDGEQTELSVDRLRNLRLRLVQPHGTVTWLQVRSQFIRSPQGRLQVVVSCFIDITAIVTAQNLVKRLSGLVDSLPKQASAAPPAWWGELESSSLSEPTIPKLEEDRD